MLYDRVQNLVYLENISSFPQKFTDERHKLDGFKVRKSDDAKIEKINAMVRARFFGVEKQVLPAIRPRTGNENVKTELDGTGDAVGFSNPVIAT
jgi:hypothetical protein